MPWSSFTERIFSRRKSSWELELITANSLGLKTVSCIWMLNSKRCDSSTTWTGLTPPFLRKFVQSFLVFLSYIRYLKSYGKRFWSSIGAAILIRMYGYTLHIVSKGMHRGINYTLLTQSLGFSCQKTHSSESGTGATDHCFRSCT